MKLTSGSGPRQRSTAALVAVVRNTSCASPGTTWRQPSMMSSLVTLGRFGGAAKRRPAKLYQRQEAGTGRVGCVLVTAKGDHVRVCRTRRANGPLAWTWASSDCTQYVRPPA